MALFFHELPLPLRNGSQDAVGFEGVLPDGGVQVYGPLLVRAVRFAQEADDFAGSFRRRERPDPRPYEALGS